MASFTEYSLGRFLKNGWVTGISSLRVLQGEFKSGGGGEVAGPVMEKVK